MDRLAFVTEPVETLQRKRLAKRLNSTTSITTKKKKKKQFKKFLLKPSQSQMGKYKYVQTGLKKVMSKFPADSSLQNPHLELVVVLSMKYNLFTNHLYNYS